MTVTAASVATWGRFKVPTDVEEVALLDLVVAGALSRIGRDYYLDSPLTADQELAVCLVAARLWKRRDTPEGRDAFGGEIAVSISADDADAVALLVPRPGFA